MARDDKKSGKCCCWIFVILLLGIGALAVDAFIEGADFIPNFNAYDSIMGFLP